LYQRTGTRSSFISEIASKDQNWKFFESDFFQKNHTQRFLDCKKCRKPEPKVKQIR
jgi:hypothetical protein